MHHHLAVSVGRFEEAASEFREAAQLFPEKCAQWKGDMRLILMRLGRGPTWVPPGRRSPVPATDRPHYLPSGTPSAFNRTRSSYRQCRRLRRLRRLPKPWTARLNSRDSTIIWSSLFRWSSCTSCYARSLLRAARDFQFFCVDQLVLVSKVKCLFRHARRPLGHFQKAARIV